MDDLQKLEIGKANARKCYGDVLPVPDGEPDYFQRMSLMTVFAEVWSRPGLAAREKRIAILGAIAGLGADPSLFEIHVRSALANGELEVNELREIILLMTSYCGYPKVSPLYLALERCIAET